MCIMYMRIYVYKYILVYINIYAEHANTYIQASQITLTKPEKHTLRCSRNTEYLIKSFRYSRLCCFKTGY